MSVNRKHSKESQLDPKSAISCDRVEAGMYYLKEIHKGQTLRITDLVGNQAVDTLFYCSHDPSERYSAADTIRGQQNIYLESGSCLRSNLDRPMLEITADTCGRHDTLGGNCSGESNSVRYDLDKRFMHSCRDNWMLAIAENPSFGLNKKDIGHNINFFMNVPVTPIGDLNFEEGISGPGKYVELVSFMDVILLISNCPQLNNPCSGFNPTEIEISIWD